MYDYQAVFKKKERKKSEIVKNGTTKDGRKKDKKRSKIKFEIGRISETVTSFISK